VVVHAHVVVVAPAAAPNVVVLDALDVVAANVRCLSLMIKQHLSKHIFFLHHIPSKALSFKQ